MANLAQWKEYIHEGIQSHQRNRHDEAERALKNACTLASRPPAHQGALGLSLERMGELMFKREEYDEAERLYEQSIEAWKRILNDRHPDLSRIHLKIADLKIEQKRWDEAETQAQTAKEFYIPYDETMVSNYIRALGKLLLIYQKSGQSDKHAQIEQQLKSIQQEALGTEDWGSCSCLEAMGETLASVGQHKEAERCFRKLHQIVEPNFGERTPLNAYSCIYLAEALLSQSKRDEAFSFYEKGLDILKETLHPDHVTLTGNAVKYIEALKQAGLNENASQAEKRYLPDSV